MGRQPVLRVLSADATDEEIAAIIAAVSAVTASGAGEAHPPDDTLHEWVRGSRLSARGAGLQRGPWRLSGRLARRAHV